MTDAAPAPLTYLLIDGENLDSTLGNTILGHKPGPDDRPRWDRVLTAIRTRWATEVRALFFINASTGFSQPFVQALHNLGIRPVLLRATAEVKVVDEGILRTLEALRDRSGNVVLGSHDADFLHHIEALLGKDRKVALLAFTELINGLYAPLRSRGLEFFDLEDDAHAFNKRLDRIRVIDLADFDPAAFL